MLISYVVSTGSFSQLVFIINLIGVWMTSSAMDDVIRKECHGKPVVDLGGVQGAPPRAPKFFQFHTVFGRIWQNCMLVPPPGELAPLGEILDLPLKTCLTSLKSKEQVTNPGN